jgi:hypothetical protein
VTTLIRSVHRLMARPLTEEELDQVAGGGAETAKFSTCPPASKIKFESSTTSFDCYTDDDCP